MVPKGIITQTAKQTKKSDVEHTLQRIPTKFIQLTATDDISKSHRDDALGKHLGNCDVGATHDAKRYDEHVCNRMIQADCYKRRYGKPNSSFSE